MKVIIVGAGEVGYHIANKLSKENKDVVLIDMDAERLKQVNDTLDVQTLHGSGASPTLLRMAGIDSADMIIAVTDSDESNLVSCLMSRLISTGTTRIARIRNQDFFDIEEIKTGEILGLSLVINPEIEVVRTILRLLEVPGAVDVIDFADGLVRLIGLKINADSNLAGLTMAELREIDPEQHILIAAIYRETSVIIPHGKTRLEVGDLVYLPARPEEVERILKNFGRTTPTVRNVFIIGGGQVGRSLALALEDKPVTVKLIERSAETCQELGEILNKTIILKGDGTDLSLLEEENVGDADVFIALTNNEEENVLSCLQAKRLGAKEAITRVNKFSYIPLVTAIGLETVVSSRLSAISVILQYIRRGKVVSVAALKGEDAEAIEFVALESSDIVGRSIEEIKFPRQALIAAIVRQNHVIIPRGQTIIQPDDRIIIFTRREAVSKVEKAFMVKLEYF
ncbi:MAG: Trk system potassium transporter TrkA [Deltaproteobacteria bacterium]|nr:Trk system potassium transporter TrkA [Deltaproteobacteria bacterium]MBW2052686.1 Trk system potassium transporter TrkA [Deltaproteobacteria bacterium]MBW2140982.1 Trk system potassium transporter TrkA [Deltaproteobacteria bacterium]MBW2323151.1 Trk system potassium transporter TrkA [Deltaproteobacteria bacterium]